MVWNDGDRPAAGERSAPPTIVVRHRGAAPTVLREVRAGAEEEGVPTSTEEASTEEASTEEASTEEASTEEAAHREGVVALAHAAALDSRLEVGVGIDASGEVAVHHATLPLDAPALAVAPDAGPPQWRRAGAVAARIVTGLPIA